MLSYTLLREKTMSSLSPRLTAIVARRETFTNWLAVLVLLAVGFF
jgi:hypothetical protein